MCWELLHNDTCLCAQLTVYMYPVGRVNGIYQLNNSSTMNILWGDTDSFNSLNTRGGDTLFSGDEVFSCSL